MKIRAALCLIVFAAPALQAQQPLTAVVPDVVTVGDVFHAAIRVSLPDGGEVLAPDSLVLGADLENAGRREIRYDTADGTRRATVLYPLAAWRPGTFELPEVTVRVVGDGAAERVVIADLPAFTVRSVLPADTAGLEAKPARDVLGANRVWWPILLVLVLLLIAAIALYAYWRRRRGAGETITFTPAVPPRAAALAELDELQRAGLLERGDVKVYYARLTAILRHYAAAVEPGWSVDLTTAELTARMRAQSALDGADLELIRILGSADLVKFARAVIPPALAARDLDAARTWVERSRFPAEPIEDEAEAA